MVRSDSGGLQNNNMTSVIRAIFFVTYAIQSPDPTRPGSEVINLKRQLYIYNFVENKCTIHMNRIALLAYNKYILKNSTNPLFVSLDYKFV